MSLLSKSKNINDPESIDIVNLSDIRNDFGGSLRRYLEDNEITDIIIIFFCRHKRKKPRQSKFFCLNGYYYKFFAARDD